MASMIKLPLLDRYLLLKLIPSISFALVPCSIVGELIGISFEQVKFILYDGLTPQTSLYIYLLKAPFFITTALPLALLLGTLFTYRRLSHQHEIVAFRSFGISPLRLSLPTLFISVGLAGLMFLVNEVVVPNANYQAAITLERAVGYHRLAYQNRDIIYQEFDQHSSQALKYLFYATQFDGRVMQKVTLLVFSQRRLQEIFLAEMATWNESQQCWYFYQGSRSLIANTGSYAQEVQFQSLAVNLGKTPLDLAQSNREEREMNLIESYRRLALLQHTGDRRGIRKLQLSIQDKYATAVSCVVFTFLGLAVSIDSPLTRRSRGLTFALMTLFAFYFLKFVMTSFAVAGTLSVILAAWLPNLAGISLSLGYLVYKRNSL
jgi:lipopolysaccharide export system permease protein